MNRKARLYRFKMPFEFQIVYMLDGEKRLLKALFPFRKQNGNNVLTTIQFIVLLRWYAYESSSKAVVSTCGGDNRLECASRCTTQLLHWVSE